MVNVGKRACVHDLMMICDVSCDVMLTVAIVIYVMLWDLGD